MENTSLHTQKVAILSRLIKETSLTLEEALLLLQEDEQPAPVFTPSYTPGTSTPWSNPYYGSGTIPLSGTVTTNASTGVYNFSNTDNTTTTVTLTPSTPTADLNN
jgi:hypothetical protein